MNIPLPTESMSDAELAGQPAAYWTGVAYEVTIAFTRARQAEPTSSACSGHPRPHPPGHRRRRLRHRLKVFWQKIRNTSGIADN